MIQTMEARAIALCCSYAGYNSGNELRYRPAEAAVQEMRSVQMPFGIWQQIKEIRAYAAVAAEVAHCELSNNLVALLNDTADDLEIISRFMVNALGPNPNTPSRATYKPFRQRD